MAFRKLFLILYLIVSLGPFLLRRALKSLFTFSLFLLLFSGFVFSFGLSKYLTVYKKIIIEIIVNKFNISIQTNLPHVLMFVSLIDKLI